MARKDMAIKQRKSFFMEISCASEDVQPEPVETVWPAAMRFAPLLKVSLQACFSFGPLPAAKCPQR